MCTSASTNWPVGVCSLKPEPEEILGPNQLPIEMLQEVLSYLPPRTLLRHCRPVCRRWRDVVDGWDLWRSILPWRHPDLWPVIRTCLPPADAPGPCILGRFCERRPIGRNLLRPEPSWPDSGAQKRGPQGCGWEGLERCSLMGNLWDFSVGWRAGRELGHKSLFFFFNSFYFVGIAD